MYDSVREIIRQHETVWSGVPKFVSAVNQFESELDALKSKAVIHNSITLGVSKNKAELFLDLSERILMLQNALWVYAIATNNFELAARHKTTISEIRNLGSSRRLLHIEQIENDLSAHESALAEFGISNENVSEFVLAVNNYRLASNQPRMAVIERKLLTQSLIEHSGNIDKTLRFTLDKLMFLFKNSAPDFVNLYKNARKVIHYGGRSNSSSKLPPTETNEDPF